jgi:hypothetical protein
MFQTATKQGLRIFVYYFASSGWFFMSFSRNTCSHQRQTFRGILALWFQPQSTFYKNNHNHTVDSTMCHMLGPHVAETDRSRFWTSVCIRTEVSKRKMDPIRLNLNVRRQLELFDVIFVKEFRSANAQLEAQSCSHFNWWSRIASKSSCDWPSENDWWIPAEVRSKINKVLYIGFNENSVRNYPPILTPFLWVNEFPVRSPCFSLLDADIAFQFCFINESRYTSIRCSNRNARLSHHWLERQKHLQHKADGSSPLPDDHRDCSVAWGLHITRSEAAGQSDLDEWTKSWNNPNILQQLRTSWVTWFGQLFIIHHNVFHNICSSPSPFMSLDISFESQMRSAYLSHGWVPWSCVCNSGRLFGQK